MVPGKFKNVRKSVARVCGVPGIACLVAFNCVALAAAQNTPGVPSIVSYLDKDSCP